MPPKIRNPSWFAKGGVRPPPQQQQQENAQITSTPHAAMAAALEVEADGEYPSCGSIDFGNVMDQDPGFFDDFQNVDNGSEFPVGPDDNSTIHAASASVADKPSGKSGKSGKQGKFSSKRPRFDAKTVSFHSNRIIASQYFNLIAPVPGIHHRSNARHAPRRFKH